MRIEKRNGMYRAQVMVDGKRISITRATESEVKKAVEEAKKGKEIVAADLTVKKAVEFYISEKEPTLSPSTVNGYKSYLRTRFQSMLHKPLISITPRQWQVAVSTEAMQHSAKSVRNAWGLFAASIAYVGFEVPKVNLPQMVQHEHEWLEPEQIPIFLNAIKGKKIEIPALLALHGLRRSEVLAVMRPGWDERVNLEGRTILVSGAVVKNSDGKMVYKETNKNSTSARTVPIIIPRLIELLRDADPTMQMNDYHPSTLLKAINSACEEAGLPKVGVHGLRHSAVSLAYSIGMNEMACMQMFGYSDYNTMRKIYTHLAHRDLDKSTTKMREFFEPKKKKTYKSKVKRTLRKSTGAAK